MIPEWCAPHGQPRDCPLHCKRDPTLHEAGVPLEKLVLPPSVSSVSRAFVDMKLVYPAKIAGIAMPWGQKIQLYIFMGQLLQGLLSAWLGTFFKQPNAVFLLANGANFALTFRRDIWLPALLQQLRLLAIYFSIGKWLGAGWKVGTIPEPSWEEMPFKCSELCLVIKIGNLVRNLMSITMVMRTQRSLSAWRRAPVWASSPASSSIATVTGAARPGRSAWLCSRERRHYRHLPPHLHHRYQHGGRHSSASSP